MNASEAIRAECDSLCGMLLEKNKSYGNSVFDPINIFSKNDWKEQIGVRIDDKLNRLKKGQAFEEEDTIKDLIGYLIILRAGERLHEAEKFVGEMTDEEFKEISNERKECSLSGNREYDPLANRERPNEGDWIEVIHNGEGLSNWVSYQFREGHPRANLSTVYRWRYK